MTPKTPSLTIAIPTYNRAQTVSRLAQSVLSQMQPGEELLVIDDGSVDNTSELLSAISGVRLHRQTPNQGMVKTWNACLRLAAGDWIGIIHDDDTLREGALEAIRLACLAADGPALIIHKSAGIEETNPFRCQTYEPGYSAVFCAASSTIPSGVVIHRKIIEALGSFDEELFYSTDIEYFARICAQYKSIVIESPTIIDYHLHGDNYQYKTWLKPDFFPQLLEIERRVISYSGLQGIEAAERLRERIIAYLLYIIHQAEHIKNRALMRKFGFLLMKAPACGRRKRLTGLAVILKSWLPLS